MKIDLLLDSDASASEVAAVTAVAQEEGICGTVEAAWASRGLEFPWVIFLLAPLGVFLSAFFSTLGKERGKMHTTGYAEWSVGSLALAATRTEMLNFGTRTPGLT